MRQASATRHGTVDGNLRTGRGRPVVVLWHTEGDEFAALAELQPRPGERVTVTYTVTVEPEQEQPHAH
ncbi:MAG: hypothetical protein M5U09_13650 [Gammaproteobacteria bacterium]|nr:hypothetical protein [Gammaproteobacteria bacterium]